MVFPFHSMWNLLMKEWLIDKNYKMKNTFLHAVKILLLVSCCYSTYDIIGYWIVVVKKDFLKTTPFPLKEIEALSGVTVLVVLLWMLYYCLSALLEKKKWKTSHSITSWDVFFDRNLVCFLEFFPKFFLFFGKSFRNVNL